MENKEIQILKNCTIKAIEYLDKIPWDSKNNSRTGDLVYNGKLYPTKPVLWEVQKQIEIEKLEVKIPSLSGGEAIFQFFEKLGFEIKRKEFIKTDSLEKLTESYIETLKLKGDPNESYKWDAIEHFQKHWNIDAVDFYKMFSEAFKKVSNLLYQNSWGFINKVAHNFPEDTREMFRTLYDENIELENRLETFKNKSEEILPRLIDVLGKDKLNTQQDERTLSVYLSFRFPEKYFIYKISFYRNLCDVLKEPKAPSGKKYFHYLKLAQKVKEDYISNNDELLELHKGIYPQFKWDDKNLITQNFLYTTLENEDVYSNLMMLRNNIENFNVFFGKVTNLRNQLQEKFYQTEDESWFGDLVEGAFVFIIGEGKIRLWRAKEWIQDDKLFRMNFEEIIEDTKLDTKALQAFKYFKLNIDLIVKTVRSTAMSRKAFFKINVHDDFSEEMLLDKTTYQNPENYRKIIVKPTLTDIVEDEFNIQIYKNNTDYDLKLPTFSESLGEFIDNTKNIGKGRTNKDKTLNKIIQNSSRVWNYEEVSMIMLYDAFFCNYNSREIEEVEVMETTTKDGHPLNQILYGAPGTGKTYATKKVAVEIIDGKDYSGIDRDVITDRYDQLFKAKQINFTTFHQSISYEDFVEGIKPLLKSDEDEDEDQKTKKDNTIEYENKDGIFKKLCQLAEGVTGKVEVVDNFDFQNKNFYKMSLGGKHFLAKHNWSIKNNLIFLGWGGDKDFTYLNKINDWYLYRDTFKKDFPELVTETKYVIQAVYTFQKMKIGDIVIISKGNHIIDAIGIIESEYFFDNTKEIDNYQFRKVKWLATDMNATPDIFVSKGISQQTIYQFDKDDIKIDAFNETFKKQSKNEEPKKYVLIIDEINRGNVSSIFGELITLLEKDKRKGILNPNREALEVELPYSRDKFSVPDNLYIVGTMNTADRSVESLDTALRRRFSFVEMQPDIEVLENEHVSNGIISSENGKIEMVAMLKTINERIEVLLDKNHKIGHSFFIDIIDFDCLKLVFKDKIIPLLEEYFFGDFGKIGLVLGGEFIKSKASQAKFATNFTYQDESDVASFSDKIVYEFTSFVDWNTKTFTSIYE